jgi:hypothetical protein
MKKKNLIKMTVTKNNMNKILIVAFVAMSISTLRAQNNVNLTEKYPHLEKNYTVAVHPLYLFNGGLRLDFEKRIDNTPAWIQIGATGYHLARHTGRSNYWYRPSGEYNYLAGGGLDLNYKRFYNRKETLYYSAGGAFTHYYIEYSGKHLRSYDEDGLTYYMYKYGNQKQKINKLGLNMYLGYQSPRPSFLFDMFVGIGYRYSFRSYGKNELYENGMIALGYRGFVVTAGVRLGIKFKR